MPRTVSALLIGMLFGAGLAVSGMMNPAKVLGFLDITGDWDPTLAFVMGGALIVALPATLLARRRARPVLAESFDLPGKRTIDLPLIAGSALFGLGWGLAGFCPGPAFAALSTGLWQVGLFVLAMLTGMLAFRLLRAN
jgi:uncharacterized protein